MTDDMQADKARDALADAQRRRDEVAETKQRLADELAQAELDLTVAEHELDDAKRGMQEAGE